MTISAHDPGGCPPAQSSLLPPGCIWGGWTGRQVTGLRQILELPPGAHHTPISCNATTGSTCGLRFLRRNDSHASTSFFPRSCSRWSGNYNPSLRCLSPAGMMNILTHIMIARAEFITSFDLHPEFVVTMMTLGAVKLLGILWDMVSTQPLFLFPIPVLTIRFHDSRRKAYSL